MCKTIKTARGPFMGLVSATALVGLLAVATPVKTQAQCNPGIGDSIGVTGPYGNNYVHVGQNATINQLIVFNSSVVVGGVEQICTATNVKSWLIYPNNSFQSVLGLNLQSAPNNVMAPGSSITCPGDGKCLAFSATYAVQLSDIGASLSFTTNWPPALGASTYTASGLPNKVLFQYATAASMVGNDTAKGSAGQSLGLTVLQPCIGITKVCATNCTTYGSPILFSGVVTNCSVLQTTASDGNLTILSITDTPPATIVFANITLKGNPFPTNGLGGVLAQGDAVAYSGSYTPAAGCGPFNDTIKVIAADLTGFLVTNSASASCHVKTSPGIALQKDCHIRGGASKTLNVGDFYVDDFIVMNTGNVPLTNAVIHNVDPLVGLIDIFIGNLAIGQTVTNHYTNGPVTSQYLCQTLTDSATVTANSACPLDATCPSALRVTNGPVTCSLTVPCVPKICVTKGIICGPQGTPPTPFCNPTNTYLKVDTGINGATFCYLVIVENCGPITLTNVTVTDTQLGTLAGFPTTLAPGQKATNTYSKAYGNPSSSTGTTNINVVNAVGTGAGYTTNATDTATAITVPIGVACSIKLSANDDLDNNTNDNHVTLPAGTNNAPVQFCLTVTNTGKASLSVSLTNVPPLVDCADDQTPVSVPSSVNIAPGASYELCGCVLVSCPGLDMNVTVRGTAVATAEVPCIYDSQGNAVTTAPSSCNASVDCAVGVNCRVTGGGTLYEGDVSTNCINVVTVLYDRLSEEAGLAVDHISHGGQLGAPFSRMDCADRLADPCIRGEWQHVRHYDAKQNGLKDVYDMSFHSANPNVTGHFDTLMCACLPCCGEVVTNAAPPGWDHFRFQVCNKDDRRICGPLPRPAPANAIIFTGIGTFTPQDSTGSGRNVQRRYVIFRVYIEDRSEPGGIHPKGGNMPGTIYCFQAWDTGVSTAKKADFSTLAPAFRTALSEDSCAFLSALSSGNIPQGSLPATTVMGVAADTVDQGPLRNGSQQIHPSTSATCNQ